MGGGHHTGQVVSNGALEKFKLCQSPKDSIWIDLTDSTPVKVRRNGYEKIKSDDERESLTIQH